MGKRSPVPPVPHDPRPALTEREAASRVRMSPAFMRAARAGRASIPGPAYVRIGKAIRYFDSDLDAWIAALRVRE
jgi:hypothetical protein